MAGRGPPLAVQASRLPETLDRLERAERVRDGLVDLLERERLPVEPVKEDYLVTVARRSRASTRT